MLRAREAGKSECWLVMSQIAVNMPHRKRELTSCWSHTA